MDKYFLCIVRFWWLVPYGHLRRAATGQQSQLHPDVITWADSKEGPCYSHLQPPDQLQLSTAARDEFESRRVLTSIVKQSQNTRVVINLAQVPLYTLWPSMINYWQVAAESEIV